MNNSLCFVVALLFLAATEAVLPNGECYVNSLTCEIDDNFIGIVDNIMNAEDCKQECENNSAGCKVYSYYGSAGVPFIDTCLLFSDCAVLDVVEDCITEELECIPIFCDAPIAGSLGDNVVDIVPGISKAECETECVVVEQCKFFTHYYSSSNVYPSTCFLLSEVQGPITACQDDTCITGSSNCENSACGFFENPNPNWVVLNETKEINLLTIGPCSSTANSVLAVVVGGGGGGGPGIYSGAGSGFVEFQELPFSQPFAQFKATVGSSEEQSTLSTLFSDVLVTALPGESATTFDDRGGDGYSGGGGGDGNPEGGDGGTDGGDGQDSTSGDSGGQGSGLDVRTIPLTHFELR